VTATRDLERTVPATPVALIKLARTLAVPVERLAFLTDVPVADLLALRRQVADMLFASQSKRLAGVAAAARVLPGPVTAKLVQLKPNALLAAGTAGLLEPGLAVDIAKRLPPALLAQMAARLDPRRAEQIIARLPAKTMVAVAEHLARAEDWVTLGDLVGVVSDDAGRATAATLTGYALVQSARMVDDPAALSHFAGLLAEPTIARMLRVVAEQELWDDLRPTLLALPDSARALARTAAETLPAADRARALAEIAAAA
jgi:hypothetical protein